MDSTVSVDDTPYAVGCNAYWEQGWVPLPLPPGKKSSPPSAYTGRDGRDPTREQINAWRQGQPVNRHPVGNICLRMTNYVIGIDVDNYGGKSGAATLAEAQRRWGALPPTYASSARELPSGIHFYRVPGELAFKGHISFTSDEGELLNGIEIIQRSHRYAVVWPSTNPDAGGAPYLWYAPDGTLAERPPNADTLPYLPDEWVKQLHVSRDLSVSYTANFESFVASLEGPDEEPCEDVARLVSDASDEIREPPRARHDIALHYIMRLLRSGDQGHIGVMTGLERLREVFIGEVSADEGSDGRSPDEAESEWDRMLYGDNGLGEIQAAPTPDAERVCLCGSNDLVDTSVGVGSSSGLDQSSSATPDADDEPRGAREILEEYVESGLMETDSIRHTKDELARRKARRTAKRIESSWTRPPAPEIMNGNDFLTTDFGEDTYLLDQVWPHGALILFSAQSKAGKTVVRNNVLKSLLDEQPLFDQYDVGTLTGNVLCVDVELTRKQGQTWFAKQHVTDANKLRMAHYRGRETRLDFRDEDIQQDWKEFVEEQNITCLLFDCVSPVMHALGIDTNENADVDEWLQGFRSTFETAGVTDGILAIHHMGHNAERARGASAFEATPDIAWQLMIEKTERGEPNRNKARFFGAFGRDVNVEPVLAVHDPTTDHYSIADEAPTKEEYEAMQADEAKAAKQSVRSERFREWEDQAMRMLVSHPDMSNTQIVKAVGTQGSGGQNIAMAHVKKLRADLDSQSEAGSDEGAIHDNT